MVNKVTLSYAYSKNHQLKISTITMSFDTNTYNTVEVNCLSSKNINKFDQFIRKFADRALNNKILSRTGESQTPQIVNDYVDEMVVTLSSNTLLQEGITLDNNVLVYKCQQAVVNTFSSFDFIQYENFSVFTIVMNLFLCKSDRAIYETITFTKIKTDKITTLNNHKSNNAYETLLKSIQKFGKFDENLQVLPFNILVNYIYDLYAQYQIKFLNGQLTDPSIIDNIFLILSSYTFQSSVTIMLSTNNLTVYINVNSCGKSYKVKFSLVNNLQKIIILTDC